ncbi:sulfatase [Brucella tritici]|uniref:Sulfatase n=1 Tax=Brucella tritici TaxID=94626 RepID=A0A6L3YUT6_9HYPH|nr:sulfatase [Brucella tritici]KAB2688382.1 sulfatase [Brucella tritici]
MNVLYIDIDSLRRDHLGCYGYHRNTSPVIDAIAREGVRFENIYVSDVPCHPSRTALWSGRHGFRTGVVGHGGTACEPFREGASRAWAGTFYEEGWMKALRDLDYHTTTISSFGERHGCWHWYAGFNEVMNCGKGGMENADEIVPLAIDWIARNNSRKWFLHVNLWDPHTPYRVPEEWGEPFAGEPLPDWMTEEVLARSIAGYGPHSPQEPTGFSADNPHAHYTRMPAPINSMEKASAWFNGYDAGVRYADEHIGHLIAALKQHGLYDDTIIVISADHGENLGELNVWGDHQTADEFTCNVPLIIRWPGQAPGVNHGLHYHFDWPATLIDGLGGKVPSVWDGKSFAPAMRQGENGGRDYLVLSQGAWAVQRGVRFRHLDEDWLMLRTWHDGLKDFGPVTLFNLTSDPHEQKDLSQSCPDIVAYASRLLDEWHGTMAERSDQDIDPLMTVLREGGPYHTLGELPAYLERLRATGRGKHAEALSSRHPQREKEKATLR